ncbi:unnamed protein product [Ostreobium quekettii]|uniref:BHLH domain-containing protein n=1 Tax=Ostreobium quekettii TaxID=121088 RepID=A0A8S1IJV3_9CHLO|nr:unnamed protein product [Ostreobium quekettii]
MERRCGRTKACREKARRERINERFQELAKLCDPEDPKTDKVSILAEAIKIITQLKVEAGQLRQLNKFLEERVGNQEKEKGKNLYQQSLMLQNQYQSGTPTVQQPAVQFPLNSLPQGRCQVTIGVPAAGMTGTSSSGAINPLTAFGSTSQPASQVGSSAAVGPPASGSNIPNASSSMPSCQTYSPGPVSWMPFMDTSQDHLLRPPAA